MAKPKLSGNAAIRRGANAASNRVAAGRVAEGSASYSAGTIKQRELDAAVRTVGGRGSKAVERARAAAQGARNGSGVFTGDRLQRLEGAVGRKLLKGAMRGMLSPAGLAEGVAGSAIRAMKDSGTYDNARNKMLKQAKGKVVKGTRKGERA